MAKESGIVAAFVIALALAPIVAAGPGSSPFVRKSGEVMSGHLTMGDNMLLFSGGSLRTEGNELLFRNVTVCLEGEDCGGGAPAQGPQAFWDEGASYVPFLGDDLCTQQTDIELSVPASGPGLVILTGTVSIELEHFPPEQDWGRFRIAEAAEACAAPGLSDVIFRVDANLPAGYYQQTHPMTRAFPVPFADTYTFSVYGAVEQGYSAASPSSPGDRYLWGNLQAVFYPE